MRRSSLVKSLRYVGRAVLSVVSLFWLVFAVLSGTENGIGGLLANLPNALPWLGLIAIVYIAFRWELAGGALVLAAGVASIVFFNAWTAPVVLLGIPLPLIAAGTALILCSILDRSDQDT